MRFEVEIRFRRRLRIQSLPRGCLPIRRFICRRRRGSLGSPRFGASFACFQARSPQLFSPSYRLSLKFPEASHPSIRQLLLGAPSLRINAARWSFDASCAYPGSRPSARHHRSASIHESRIFRPAPLVETSQVSTMFRPQALTASRRFSPRIGSQAYFIPQPCPGPILFRGLFSPRSRTILPNPRSRSLVTDGSSIAQQFPPCR
jgi:hypothetical protein